MISAYGVCSDYSRQAKFASTRGLRKALLCRGAATRRPFDALASPKIYSFRPCRVIRSLLETCPCAACGGSGASSRRTLQMGHRETKQSMQRVNLRNAPSVSLRRAGSPTGGVIIGRLCTLQLQNCTFLFQALNTTAWLLRDIRKSAVGFSSAADWFYFCFFTSSSARAGGLRAGRATTPCSHSGQVYRRAQQDAPEQSSKWRGCRCSRAGRISPARSTRER